MRKLTKKQKKHLIALGGKAYEIDLGRSIDKLFDKYQLYKNQKISVWDMNQWIHEFHDEIARDLYKSYTAKDPIYRVAIGIATGAINISEVDESCINDVKKIVEFLENNI